MHIHQHVLLLQMLKNTRVCIFTELLWTQFVTSGLHFEADGGAVLLARLSGLNGDSLAEVVHSVRGQGVDGCQDGGVGVLVGVGHPGVLRDAEAGGGVEGWPRGVVGRVGKMPVRRVTAGEAVLPLGAVR